MNTISVQTVEGEMQIYAIEDGETQRIMDIERDGEVFRLGETDIMLVPVKEQVQVDAEVNPDLVDDDPDDDE